MDKALALKIIFEAAHLYENNFDNSNLLIITGKQSDLLKFEKLLAIETKAIPDNFLHLTGVSTHLTARQFFNNAKDQKLAKANFDFKDSTTEKKLETIKQALSISRSFRMVGSYDSGRPNLQTDVLIGGTTCSIGFVEDNGYYFPNTLLKGDVRNDTKETARVLAVLKKGVVEPEYTEIKYLAKDVFAHKLLETLKSKNPQIPLESFRVNYKSLSRSQQVKEAEFLRQQETEKQKEQLKEISEELLKRREQFVHSQDGGTQDDNMQMYLDAQSRFLETADRAMLYEYAKELLDGQEKMYRDDGEILSYIGEEIKEVQMRQDQDELSPRKADITVGIRNLKLDADKNSAALNATQVHTISVPIPPKKPFKALYIKLRDTVKDLFSKNGKNNAPESSPNKQGSSTDAAQQRRTGSSSGDEQALLKKERTEDMVAALTQDVAVKTPISLEISDDTPPETASETILQEPVPEVCKPETDVSPPAADLNATTSASVVMSVTEAVEAAPVKKETKPKKKSKQFEYGD